jgi:hypothetical protein
MAACLTGSHYFSNIPVSVAMATPSNYCGLPIGISGYGWFSSLIVNNLSINNVLFGYLSFYFIISSPNI